MRPTQPEPLKVGSRPPGKQWMGVNISTTISYLREFIRILGPKAILSLGVEIQGTRKQTSEGQLVVWGGGGRSSGEATGCTNACPCSCRFGGPY